MPRLRLSPRRAGPPRGRSACCCSMSTACSPMAESSSTTTASSPSTSRCAMVAASHSGARRAGGAAILSGRSAAVVERRAAELGIHPVFQGAGDKAEAFTQLRTALGLEPHQVSFMGDDLPDLPVLTAGLGVSACPADADHEVRERVDLVTDAGGGQGAVRELIEILLKAAGEWEPIVAGFLPSTERDAYVPTRRSDRKGRPRKREHVKRSTSLNVPTFNVGTYKRRQRRNAIVNRGPLEPVELEGRFERRAEAGEGTRKKGQSGSCSRS